MKKILIAALALSAAACAKVETNLTYIVKPYLQTEQGGAEVEAVTVVGYLFFADTTYYEVTSYDDAISGTMSQRGGDGEITADMVGVAYGPGEFRLGPVKQDGPVTLVVADADFRCYAVCMQQVVADLDRIELPLHFKTWLDVPYYTEGKWKVYP